MGSIMDAGHEAMRERGTDMTEATVKALAAQLQKYHDARSDLQNEVAKLRKVEDAAEIALSEWANGTSETGLSDAMQKLASVIYS